MCSKAFDQDTRGTVDFFELICGLSIVFNGVPLQKLMGRPPALPMRGKHVGPAAVLIEVLHAVCFHAFDEDNDNQLTMKEMQLFVETHYKWLLRLLNKDKVMLVPAGLCVTSIDTATFCSLSWSL